MAHRVHNVRKAKSQKPKGQKQTTPTTPKAKSQKPRAEPAGRVCERATPQRGRVGMRRLTRPGRTLVRYLPVQLARMLEHLDAGLGGPPTREARAGGEPARRLLGACVLGAAGVASEAEARGVGA